MAAILRQARLVRESFKRFIEEAVEVRRALWPSRYATDSSLDEYESDDDEAEDRKWKDKKYEILKDINPVLLLTKNILSSQRYMDGAVLTVEDEQVVIKKLLAYHPHYEDKIGCGLESIMEPSKFELEDYYHWCFSTHLELPNYPSTQYNL